MARARAQRRRPRRGAARAAGRAPPGRGGGRARAGGRPRAGGARAGRGGGGDLLGAGDRAEIAARIVRDSVGLGPLEVLLADPAVEEVMVNGPGRVYVERGGRIEADRGRLRRRGGAAQRDRADPGAARAPRRRAQPDGRRPPRRRLAGQRRDPAAGDRRAGGLDPPLRRPPARARRAGRARDARAPPSATCCEAAVAARRSILVSGGTGSGKTTLLNALSSFIAAGERVVTIEDAAELRLQQPHVVRLESRPAGVEGRGEVTIRDLLRNALRMRPGPDRDRRGARAGGARPADRAQHRPRRRPLDRPRQLARRRAAPAGDAGADGRGRPAARGDRRAGAARHRPRRPPASGGPTARGW